MKFSRFLLLSVVVVLVVIGVVIFRSKDEQSTKEETTWKKPIVNYIIAATKTAPTELKLPAALQAFQDTPIYARTTGYVAKWFFDIGDHVKTNDILALIDTPDLDEELNQAKANLGQTQANLDLAKISAERWKALGEQHAVAQQDVDTKSADYAARQADTKAAQANVERLTRLKDYQHVTAPYDGVVSARNAQVGALITSGTSTELFHLSQTETLRVYVNVPQSYIRSITPDLDVQVIVPEFLQPFKGKVVRFAGALDPVSRTLLVEIQIPNTDGKLFPGMFCEVHFDLLPPAPAIIIPSNAILVRADGTIVATVDDANRIHLAHVKVGRDFGTQVEIVGGLNSGSHVVANPTDALSDNLEVEAHDQKAEEVAQKKKDDEDKNGPSEKNQGKPAKDRAS